MVLGGEGTMLEMVMICDIGNGIGDIALVVERVLNGRKRGCVVACMVRMCVV